MGNKSKACAMLAILITSTLFFTGMSASVTSKNTSYFQPIQIIPHDENGNIISGAKVEVYYQFDESSDLLYSTQSNDVSSVAHLSLTLDDIGFVEINKQQVTYYRPLNIFVTVEKDNLFGSWHMSIFPTTNMTKMVTIDVPMYDVTKQGSTTSEFASSRFDPGIFINPGVPLAYEWKSTIVLKYATWNNIQEKWDFPTGAQITVQSKMRVNFGNWLDNGYSTVVIDAHTYQPNYVTGQKLYTVNFTLKYMYGADGGGPGWKEYVSVVDTAGDPQACVQTSQSWNGDIGGYSKYYEIGNGIAQDRQITGGYYYVFSPGVSVTFVPYPSISVSLSVTKQASPTSTLTIYPINNPGGHVHVCDVTGGASTLIVNSRTNWG